MLGAGGAEGGEHDRGGDPGVGAHVQRVAGVVVEPADDLHVGGVDQPVVGEVGLPALVGLVGLEPQVGGLGSFPGRGDYRSGAEEDPVDRGARQLDLMAMSEVPADGVRAGVEASLAELLAQPQHLVDYVRAGRVG